MNSAELLEQALEARDSAVMVIACPTAGESAMIVGVNRPMARLLGTSEGVLSGAPLQTLRASLADEADWLTLLGALRDRTTLNLDIRLRHGAQEQWLGVGLTFLASGAEGSTHGILVGRDITESRRRGLQDSEMQRLLAAVFVRIGAAVAIVRSDGTLLMANPAFQALLHYEAEAIVGMNVADLIAPETSAAMPIPVAQDRDSGRSETAATWITGAGTRRAVTVVSAPLENWHAQSLRVLTVFPDRDRPIRQASDRVPVVPPAAGPAMVSVGQIQAISLAAFKNLFGAAWESIANRAVTLAEQILGRRLTGADVFKRGDADSFVIWFDSPDHAANSAVLAAASREIRLRFLSEFGEAASAHVTMVVVSERPDPAGAEAPEAFAALLQRLQDARQRDAAETTAMLRALRDRPATDIRPVIDRDGAPRPIAVIDFTPLLRRRLGSYAAPAPAAGADTDPDLLRLELAGRELRSRRDSVVVPLAWAALAGVERRRAVERCLVALEPAARARLILAVSGAPPLPSSRRWTDVIGPLRGGLGDIGLVLTLSEGDNIMAVETMVARWPVGLVVLDATEPGSLGPDGYVGLITAARRRDAAVLARCAATSDVHDWRELGATMFTVPE